MSSRTREGIRAVLLDAFGTLVAMEPPAPHLRTELRRRTGVDVGAEPAEAAFAAEIAFYLEHHLDGRDRRSLEELRDRCAAVIADTLALATSELGAVRAAMLASLRFRAQPDAVDALRALRAGGADLVVASNWDCSLSQVLEDAAFGGLVDAVISSAAVGAPKPDPAVFEAALAAVHAGPEEAVHVGDSVIHDVAGAHAAGVGAVLLDRRGDAEPTDAPVIRSLRELPSLVFRGR